MSNEKDKAEKEHPMLKARIHIFTRENYDGEGAKCTGRFYPYKAYPVVFTGKDGLEVFETMCDFVDEAVAATEKVKAAKAKGLAKGAATRAAKKGL